MTNEQLITLNHMLPGSTLKFNGLTLVCHESRSYLTGYNCRHCALYRIDCDGVNCLKGMPITTELVRPEDVYFTLYFG